MEINVKQVTFQSAGAEQAVTGWIYTPSGRVRGVVVICHGMLEHMGRYHDFMRYLAQNELVAAGVDHLGHGQTAQGHLGGYFATENGWRLLIENQRKLVRIVENEFPSVPIFLLGHSMGSFIARLYASKYGGDLSGLLLSGTGLYTLKTKYAAMRTDMRIKRHGKEYADKELTRETFGGLNAMFGKNAPPNAWITRDEELLRQRASERRVDFTLGGWQDVHTLNRMSSQWKCFEQTPKNLPVLLFSGDCDPVGDRGKNVRGVAKLYLKAGLSDVTIRLYAGARHEPLQELNRAQVYSDVRDWIYNRSEAGEPDNSNG